MKRDPVALGWPALAALAARHHGVLTVDQLLTGGVSRRQVTEWVRSGRLVPIARGAYLVGGAPPTFEARVVGAISVHGNETWASHRTAAALWGIEGFPEDHRIELLRTDECSNERRGAVVHRSSVIPPEHVTVHRGVPVTTPARTLMDLAGTVGPLRIRRAVAEAVRAGLCTDAALHVVLARLAGRGRPGTRRLRDVLAGRKHIVPGHSVLEDLGRAIILAAGLPEPAWEVNMSDEQGWIGRVDGLYRPAGVVLELDSGEHHGQDTDEAHDAARDRRLEALGLVVVRRTWEDLTQRPAELVARLTELLDTRDPAA